MSYFVYLIISKKNSKFFSYVGYTNNLINRLSLHNNSKGAKYTKGKNWRLIYYKKYYSKKKAMSEEYKLKKNYKLRKKIKSDYINKEYKIY
ncbi:GIY-YIG nuclease family protein [Candidatus Pelagibacter sp.]|uniref:GIY-YIG nuclease family protein n=1 Tax=Candidatus Pelagibacter sp. TaxID=2024849 RepID=UPI003F82CA66